MNRDVTLTLKVRDAEVTKAEASVRRLKSASDDLNRGPSSFGGKKPIEDAEQQRRLAAFLGKDLPKSAKATSDAMSKVDDATAAVGTSMATTGAEAGTLAGAMGPVAAAIMAVVAAAVVFVAIGVTVAKTVTKLSAETAAYSVEIDHLAEKYGLATSTVVALRQEAERQGRSFEGVAAATATLRKNIGEAAAGSADARAKLRLLGIDGSRAIYDVDAAFKQSIVTIVKAPNDIERARLSFAAFGEDGYKLIPFFKSFNGDVDKAIKHVTDLGLVMGDKTTAAAKQFTREYADAKAAVQGLTYTFGRELMPIVTNVINAFTSWFKQNKVAINDWAVSTGNLIRGVVNALKELVEFANRHPWLIRGAVAVATNGQSELGYWTASTAAGTLAQNGQLPMQPVTAGSRTIDYSRPNYEPDPAALEAARAEAERKMKELLEHTKRDWEAAISLTKKHSSQLIDSLQPAFEKLQEQFKATGDEQAFQAGVGNILTQYIRKIQTLDALLTKLENGRAGMETMTPNERALLEASQQERVRENAARATDVQQKANEQIRAAQKRDMLTEVRETEQHLDGLIDLRKIYNTEQMRLDEDAFEQGLQTERNFVDNRKMFIVDNLEFEKWALDEQIKFVKKTIAERGDLEGQLSVKLADLQAKSASIEAQIKTTTTLPALTAEEQIRRRINKLLTDNSDIIDERRRTFQASEEEQILSRIIALQDKLADGGVNDKLIVQAELLEKVLELRERELNAVIAIARAQMELDQSMKISANQIKARVYEHLAQQKNLNEAIADGITKTYDAIGAKMDEQIDKAFEWAGVFKSLFTEPLKAFSRNSLTNLTRGLLDSIIPGLGTEFTKTNNPVARPIVDKLEETNDLLRRIAGGSPALPGASFGGFNLGSIFGGGGMGPGGTPMFNPGGGGFGGWGSIFNPTPGATGSINANGEYVVNGNQGNWLSNIRNTFSSNPGGIFAPTTNPITGKQNSALSGYLGGAGALASMVGSFIPGRAGSTIAMAGQGLQIGAMFGPWGAAIGAGVGALIGFLGFSDPKRKQDKQENMPRLRQGFTDATEKLQQILADLRSLNGDPDALLSQAREVRSQMASGFGIQMLSKKYRKQSQQLIAQQLAAIDRQPDGLMAQIIAAAGIARGAADRSKRILPEFASGVFIDPQIWHPNGLLPGVFDGRDDIIARLTKGEMVLNPAQQARARSLAGFDVFAGAGIPNYPNASPSAALANGGIAGSGLTMPTTVVQPQFTLELSGVTLDEKVEAYLTSDKGVRTQIAVTKTLKKRGDI